MQPGTPSDQPQNTSTSPSAPPSAPDYTPSAAEQVPRVTLGMGVIASDEALAAGSQYATPVQSKKYCALNWKAKEYIAPEKNTTWYILLGLVLVGVIALDVLFLKAYTVSALFVAIAVAIVVMSVRPPRDIDYTLSEKGIYVGGQLYDFADYRAFGVLHDGKENSIMLIPVKRFRPGLSVYFPVQQGEQIVDILGQKLPMEELHLDFVDKIVRWLRL